jgi:TPR repeat protein
LAGGVFAFCRYSGAKTKCSCPGEVNVSDNSEFEVCERCNLAHFVETNTGIEDNYKNMLVNCAKTGDYLILAEWHRIHGDLDAAMIICHQIVQNSGGVHTGLSRSAEANMLLGEMQFELGQSDLGLLTQQEAILEGANPLFAFSARNGWSKTKCLETLTKEYESIRSPNDTQSQIAYWLFCLYEINEDNAESAGWLLRAAGRNPDAQFNLALECQERFDIAGALALFSQSAAGGSAQSSYNCALYILENLDIVLDDLESHFQENSDSNLESYENFLWQMSLNLDIWDINEKNAEECLLSFATNLLEQNSASGHDKSSLFLGIQFLKSGESASAKMHLERVTGSLRKDALICLAFLEQANPGAALKLLLELDQADLEDAALLVGSLLESQGQFFAALEWFKIAYDQSVRAAGFRYDDLFERLRISSQPEQSFPVQNDVNHLSLNQLIFEEGGQMVSMPRPERAVNYYRDSEWTLKLSLMHIVEDGIIQIHR